MFYSLLLPKISTIAIFQPAIPGTWQECFNTSLYCKSTTFLYPREEDEREGELVSAMPKRRPNLSLTAEITLTGGGDGETESVHWISTYLLN